jgi:hypothetical protein
VLNAWSAAMIGLVAIHRAAPAAHTSPGVFFLGLGLLQWTALAAIAGFVLAAAAIGTIVVTVSLARADRQRDDSRRQQDRERDDIRRQEDRQWDSDRRKEDREHDAELRREDSEREDRLRREADEKWDQRRRGERRQREDDDAQEQVVIEFLPGGPLSDAHNFVTTADGITHRIIVTTPAAYPIKGVDAQIVHRANSNLGIFPPGRSFTRAATANGQVQYTCFAHVPPGTHDATSIVRFTDRNGNLYYSYLGCTRRFGQNTDFIEAAAELDRWIRTGPKPDEPAS